MQVRIGLSVFPTDRSWAIDELSAAAESRGVASIMVTEHTHMPIDHSEHKLGGQLPEHYLRTLDPFLALGAAAAATQSVELITGVSLVAQRDPIVTAKEVATLDLLSSGRVTFGVGYGWNIPEVEHHGVAFVDRRAVVRDRLDLMKTLWVDEVASLDAEHAKLAPSWAWPKPLQRPHPPILLGADLGPRTLQELVTTFDGWLPIGARAALEGTPRLKAAWQEAGRERAPMIHVVSARPDADYLRRLADAGIERASIWLPSADRATTLPALDELASVITELGEHV
jgi:probable F420-dependent oxidoreductase